MLIEMIGVGGKPAIINGHEGSIFFLSLFCILCHLPNMMDGWKEKKQKQNFKIKLIIYTTHILKNAQKKLKNFKNKTKIYSNDKHS